MIRYNVVVWALGTVVMSASVARPACRGVTPELIGLLLRMTLPIMPKLTDTLVALQAGGHWHHVATTLVA